MLWFHLCFTDEAGSNTVLHKLGAQADMCGKAALLKTYKDVEALTEKEETTVMIAMTRALKVYSWLLADEQQMRASEWTRGATKRYAAACSAGKAVTVGPTDSASNDSKAIVHVVASAAMSQTTSQRTTPASSSQKTSKSEKRMAEDESQMLRFIALAGGRVPMSVDPFG